MRAPSSRKFAGIAAVLLAATGCGSNERRSAPAQPCGRADVLSLCVTVDGTARSVHRLADSAAPRDPVSGNRATRLVALPVPQRDVELSLRPAQPLRLVEISLYRSVRALGRKPPIESVECTATCGRWATTASAADRRVYLPAADIAAGNVLVVAAFAETPSSVEHVSWGVLFRSTVSPG